MSRAGPGRGDDVGYVGPFCGGGRGSGEGLEAEAAKGPLLPSKQPGRFPPPTASPSSSTSPSPPAPPRRLRRPWWWRRRRAKESAKGGRREGGDPVASLSGNRDARPRMARGMREATMAGKPFEVRREKGARTQENK